MVAQSFVRIVLPGLAAAALAACANAPAPVDAARIDAEIERLMTAEDVKGLAIAIVDDREILHLAAHGARNVELGLPLEPDTVMYGASLTKTAFAYMVLQLVDEGRIDLDATIESYLPKPLGAYEDWADVGADPRWRALTPRIILSHATGLANLRFLEEDGRLRFHFDPGERYAYSGEGFWILQLALEEGLGLDIKAEMQRRIFDRFAMTRTSMQWRDDFADNLADGYGIDGEFEPHDERSNVAAAGSMDTTIADQARMWRGMLAGEGLSAASRAELVRAQRPIRSATQFPSLTTKISPGGAEIGLAAGLGVIVFEGPEGRVWMKGGHNPWTGNMAVCDEAQKRCVVLLSNSVRAEIIYPEIVELALGETNAPWWWEYPQYNSE